MFDFGELLTFLKSIFDAIVTFAKKLGLKVGQEEETAENSAG